MASIGVNWAGVVVTLTESDTKELETADDIAAAAAALIGAAAGPLGAPPATVVAEVVGAYLKLDKQLLLTIDQGYGVYLTLPWLAIWFYQLWLIIPTPVRAPSQQVPGFRPNEDWTHGPCYGTILTTFADVTGDGRADAIVVNGDTITVRRSTGNDFGPNSAANEDWTHGPYYGTRGTFFADVTGDGKADAIVVNDDTITVRRAS